MTTKISCKIQAMYLKDHDGEGPTVCAIMTPSYWDLFKMLLSKFFGMTRIFYYPLTDAEVQEFYTTIKHWIVVKHLRVSKPRAK